VKYCKKCGYDVAQENGAWVDYTDGDACKEGGVHEPAPPEEECCLCDKKATQWGKGGDPYCDGHALMASETVPKRKVRIRIEVTVDADIADPDPTTWLAGRINDIKDCGVDSIEVIG
jgi:hypothetical protein